MASASVGQQRAGLSLRLLRLFKLAYYLGKFLGLLPMDYNFRRNLFHTSRRATTTSIVICILVAMASPLAMVWNSLIYYVSGTDIDGNMSLVTASQFSVDFAASFVVLVSQLCKRKQLSRSANDFGTVFQQLSAAVHIRVDDNDEDNADEDGIRNVEMGCDGVITLEIVLLIAIKFSITMYKLLINVPFFIQYGGEIPAASMVAFLLNADMAQIAVVFSDMVFAVLLVLARYFHLVDDLLEQLNVSVRPGDMAAGRRTAAGREQLVRLMRVYVRLKRMTGELSTCIGVQMLSTFTDMLTNLYPFLDFYAMEKCLDVTVLVYNVIIFSDICCLVLAAERVKCRSERLRDTLLSLDVAEDLRMPQKRDNSFVFEWWPEVYEIRILGMFSLDNTFLIFVIAYSTNVILSSFCNLSFISWYEWD